MFVFHCVFFTSWFSTYLSVALLTLQQWCDCLTAVKYPWRILGNNGHGSRNTYLNDSNKTCGGWCHNNIVQFIILSHWGQDKMAAISQMTLYRWRPVLYFPDTEFHTFFSGQVPISSDFHVVWTFPDMSGARPSCRSWPDCSLWPFPLPSSYMHVVANKLENSCHPWMSLCNRFDFGTSKHPSMFYLSNHSAAKLTLNMRRNFRQPKHRWVHVRSPPSWIWIRDDKLTLVKSGCAKMLGELLSHIVVFDS